MLLWASERDAPQHSRASALLAAFTSATQLLPAKWLSSWQCQHNCYRSNDCVTDCQHDTWPQHYGPSGFTSPTQFEVCSPTSDNHLGQNIIENKYWSEWHFRQFLYTLSWNAFAFLPCKRMIRIQFLTSVATSVSESETPGLFFLGCCCSTSSPPPKQWC